jgi:hypothetical protein
VKGEFLIKKNIGDTGAFGKIELNIVTQECDKLEIEIVFVDKNIPKYIKSSIEFGCFNAFETLGNDRLNTEKYIVTIENILWHNIDSSTALIAYIAAKAIYNALGRENEIKYPVQEGRLFTFKKWYSLIDWEK